MTASFVVQSILTCGGARGGVASPHHYVARHLTLKTSITSSTDKIMRLGLKNNAQFSALKA